MTYRVITIGPRGMMQPPDAAGATLESKLGAEFGWDQRVFPTGQERQLDVAFVVPTAWEGDTITVKFRMRTASVAGDCLFDLHYAVIPLGSTNRAAVTMSQFSTQQTTTVPGVAYQEFEVTFSDIPVVLPGDVVMLRLLRDGTDPNDTTGDILLMESTITYSEIAGGTGVGQTNTASNRGAGVGVYSVKVGVDLQFRSLTSSDGTLDFTSTADELDMIRAFPIEKFVSGKLSTTQASPGPAVGGMFVFDPALYPNTTQVSFGAVGWVDGVTLGSGLDLVVSLYNVTDGEPVTGSSLTFNTSTPTDISVMLVLSVNPGDIKTAKKIYEVRAVLTGAVDPSDMGTSETATWIMY